MTTMQPSAGIGSRLSSTAYAPDHACAYDSWGADGNMLRELDRKLGGYLGDWLNFGETHFPDRYSQALEATELDYNTLAHYAYVSRRFLAARRRAGLSWSHHRVLADLKSESEQDEWLVRAEQEGWSVRSLVEARRKPAQIPVATSQLSEAFLVYLRQLPVKAVELYKSGVGSWVEQVDGPNGTLEMTISVSKQQVEPAMESGLGDGHDLGDVPDRHATAPHTVSAAELIGR